MQPIIKEMININPTQNDNSFIKEYAGFVNFKDIKPYLRFTSRNLDIEKQDNKNQNNTLYQRILDESRVNQIYKFLNEHYNNEDANKILPFPTPVTLSIESEFIDEDPEQYFKNNSAVDSVIYNNQLYINPNRKDKIFFIVDGQHRLAGIKEFTKINLFSASKQEISIYLTLLVNYDLSMQAQVFANINFKVKPVNKSLYYDIFGSLPDEYNELTFAHMLVKRINKDSEIGGLIKMLGTGSGTVSLAFMVETIVDELINKKSHEKPSLYDICQLYMKDQEKFKEKYGKLGKLFVEYFKIIKEELPNTFPKKESNGEYKSSSYDSILMKTTGVFSLLKLLNHIDIKGILEQNQTDDEMKKSFVEKLRPILTVLKENEKVFFSKEESEYASGGSRSLQQKLYKAIEGKLQLT
jgi:DGQHR domain-containing protein